MRVLDPRLLDRARAVRPLLVADVALGLCTAGLVLAQATLLAEVIARSFDGATLSSLRTPLVLLAACFAVRGLLAWGFEVAGRLAATSVLSQLRMGLVNRRLVDQPAALDGAHSGELATAAVFGAVPLEAYFGRFLPQLVLACVVPVAVIVWIVPIDATSAAIMLLTLPLVPLFMILVGTYTRRRTSQRRQALDLLASHFLDVIRGLPTLRAFNRGEAQAESIAEAGDGYRRATIGTLRVAFLSGAVLELAATLGVALVAVTVGVRLDDGGLSFQAALTVLILAPELYLPLRTVGTLYHTSADGLEVAERLLPLSEPLVASSAPGCAPPAGPIRCEAVGYRYPARDAGVLSGIDLQIDPGELVVLVGESGSGKSTLASVLLGLVSPTDGRVTVGGVDLAGCDQAAWRRGLAWVPQRPTLLRESVADNIRMGDLGRRPAGGARRCDRGRRRLVHRVAAPGVRHDPGRWWPTGFGGAAAADRAGSGVPSRRAAGGAGRADRQRRLRDGRCHRRGDRTHGRHALGAGDRPSPRGDRPSRSGGAARSRPADDRRPGGGAPDDRHRSVACWLCRRRPAAGWRCRSCWARWR